VVTLTPAVRLGGLSACLAFEGVTDAACFETDSERCLAPALGPGDLVILDHLSAPKTAAVAAAVRAAGAELWYLPASTPDLKPIELMFSKLKASLRSAAAPTVQALSDALGQALRAITRRTSLGGSNTWLFLQPSANRSKGILPFEISLTRMMIR
jgi:transposase